MHFQSKRVYLLVIFLGIIVLTSCQKINTEEKSIRKALVVALHPNGNKRVITEMVSKMRHGPTDLSFIRKSLGTNNLSSVLLLMVNGQAVPNILLYDFSAVDLDVGLLVKKLEEEYSCVVLDDLRDLRWERVATNYYKGTFVVAMNYGLKAKFIFESKIKDKKMILLKLVIAKKTSDNINDGFAVYVLPRNLGTHN